MDLGHFRKHIGMIIGESFDDNTFRVVGVFNNSYKLASFLQSGEASAIS